MAYWLLKSEPETWSWADQVRVGVEPWNGVRNFEATRNLRAMALGDQAFFYHSVTERAIVGMVEVVRTFYPDPADPSGKFGMVDVRTLGVVPRPVTLAQMRVAPELEGFALLTRSRLSVVPVSEAHWQVLLRMGGL